jgi:peptide/nickel transport system substrate-binding protein
MEGYLMRMGREWQIGLLVICLALTLCTIGAEEKPLIISQRSDALTLDPYDENESPTFCVLHNLFEALTDLDQELRLVPKLATSWKAENDTTWVFTLRKGITFHNGATFYAADAKYSIERALTWEGSEIKASVLLVDTVETSGPYTLRIITKKPDPILPLRLEMVMMLDKETCEREIAAHGQGYLVTHPNGTGPYKLVEWVKDDHLTLVAFDRYWRGPARIKHVVFKPITNEATRVAALLTGKTHIITEVPVRDIDRVEKDPKLRLVKKPGLRLIYLGLDVGRDKTPTIPSSPPNPLKDLRVRQAMYYGINEEAIVKYVMNGLAEPAGQLFPEPVVGYNPAIKRYPYDPEKARALLAEAGYPNGFDVRLDAPNDRYVNDDKIARAVASELAKIGIRVQVNAYPKAKFFQDEEEGKCSFYLIGWANNNGDGCATFEYLLHTRDDEKNLGSANNSTYYSNPELDRLTELAAHTLDLEQRNRYLEDAVAVAMHDLVHIPLHYQHDLYGISREVLWTPRRDTRISCYDVAWRE